jgi:hypothetical protein
MTSAKQRRANRLNAQKSTGPKSGAGKSVISNNAFRHGLSVAIPHDSASVVDEISNLIMQDNIDRHSAINIAEKILDYERNLAHQRRMFVVQSENATRVPDCRYLRRAGNQLIKALKAAF